MSQITINKPVTPVVPPTPITNGAIVAEGVGEVGVQLPNFVNDGNAPATLQWAVANVQNGTFVSTAVDTGNVAYKGASGTQVVQPGQHVSLKFFFNCPAGAPGVAVPPCTAEYTAQWV